MGWYGPQSGDCSCCEEDPPSGCVILTDDFTRADSTDIGGDWEEVAGDWSISSDALTTSSSSALCIATAERDPLQDYTVSATLSHESQLVFDYVDDDNYHAIRFFYAGASSSLILVRVAAGSATNIAFVSSFEAVDSTVSVKICVLGSRIICNIVGADGVARTFSPHGGLRAGFRATTTTITVDSFAFRYYGTDVGCEECTVPCESECCSVDPAMEYVVDLGTLGWTDLRCTCTGLGGEYTLSYYGPTGCYWRYDDPDFECDNCEAGVSCQAYIELGLTGCEWSVRCYFNGHGVNHPDCGDPATDPLCTPTGFAEYKYTQTDPSDCSAFEYTLTLEPGSHLSQNCSGSWPATITLRPV